MDTPTNFEYVDLSSFESEGDDPSYSFAGISLSSQATKISRDSETEWKLGRGISIERFFEVCFDSGVSVYAESGFTKGRLLGSGSSMAVYQGTWKEKKMPVALKYFKNALWGSANTVGTSSKEHRHLLEACMLELQVLSDISVRNHDNIVTLLAVSWTLQEGNIYPILVTELACEEYPTLAQFLPKFDPALSARYELCQHVVEGLLAIHNLRVVYGDIKPENILIFQSKSGSFGFTAKLSDFGFCQPSDDSNLEAGGTPYWNAPECVAGASLDLKAHAYTPCRDIYTLGLLITYILTGAKPFGALSKEGIIEMKMQNQVSRLVSSKLSSIGHMQNSGQTTSLTCDFINTIRRMVLLSPEDRPSLHDIQKSFESVTGRKAASRAAPPRWHVLNPRFSKFKNGSTSWHPGQDLDISTPMELRQELYKHALVVANNGSHVEKSGAMYRLGMFFLTAFGTEKSVRNAFTWFCRAAEHDSIDAMGMIFRVEKATQETSTPLKANISTNTRARWIMSHLLSSLNSHYDPRLAPPSLDLNAIHSRIRQVLESIDPDILVHALKEDVEINIIRPKVDVNYYELITSKSSQRAQQLAANSPRLREILNAVSQHDVEALDDLLQRTTQLPPDFFNCLVTLAADRRSGNVLRSLVLKHGADPDWVDTHGGRHNTSLVDAVLRDDYEMAATLIDCGADATMLHAVTDLLVTECSTSIMRLALSTWLSIKIVTDNEDVYSGSSICHQFLDGVTPLMAEKYIQTGVPPDSSCMTPLFFAVVTNSLEKLQALLVSGANPNVRFQGMTPLHLAVSLLRPTSVLLLLAFGADPNSRNSRKAYITPLHTLSECFMIPIYDSSQDGSSKSGSYRQDVRWKGRSLEDLIQRRALIINILLKYGADPAVWCIDGFTPLMTAMANPHSKSDAVCTLLIQAGVSLDDLTPRGENIIHLAARMRDVYWLQRMLSASGSRLVNVRDNTLSTPLFLAARGKDAPEALDVLIAHGADIGIRGMYNLSCLDVAVLEGCQKNLITLLDHVANISVSKRRRLFEENDIQGRTPLHICLGSPDLDLACTYIRRILKIEKHVLYHLVTRRDYFGATPIDYAHFTGNYHALQLIAQFFLPIHLPVHISNSPTWQHCERFPNTGPILSSLTSYLAVESIVNDTRLTDISKCYDDCESSPTTKTMSAVENGLQRYLEEWRQSDGNQSERVILCMNYLATVSERYGRLRRSQDLYHKGWRLARSVFGEDSVVTQDFACKFLRVIEDRGLDTRICEEIAKWNSSRGRNNLTRSRLTQINTGGTANENSVAYESDRMGGLRPRECDRWKCSKTASFFCKGCNYIRYCSEACRIADMTDAKVHHHLACTYAEPITSSRGLGLSSFDPMHSEIRASAQETWDAYRKLCPRAPSTMPPLKRSFTIRILDMEEFTTPVYYPMEENTILELAPTTHYEIRYSMRAHEEWVTCAKGIILTCFSSEEPLCICIRPKRDEGRGSLDTPKDIIIGIGIVVDHRLLDDRTAPQSYEEDTVTVSPRLASKETNLGPSVQLHWRVQNETNGEPNEETLPRAPFPIRRWQLP